MIIGKANRIKELRTGRVVCSYRRVAEIIEDEFPEFPELRGNQMYGKDLIIEAMETIYGKDSREFEAEIWEEWYF